MGFNPTDFLNVAKEDMGDVGNLILIYLENYAEGNIYNMNEDKKLIEFLNIRANSEDVRFNDKSYLKYILYVYNNGVLNKLIKQEFIGHDKLRNLIMILPFGKKHVQDSLFTFLNEFESNIN